ncbi:ribosomal RNA processing protein 36-like protein [Nephila pilipes]|uniref:rRNA biogenesis protein RRP36 n=1 Tax=Nephila pilipes TaxID=299642 RepID=A0A8X6QFM7_NEPPI|nr:ribosomal RNA processing protein 36-like protein [Nephila pilipes]
MAFRRANKNRPRELSSKAPVPIFREVYQEKKTHYRDPRFDDLSGSFNNEEFVENFSFLKDIKEREKKELEKELENVGDDMKRKKQILSLLQKMRNQEKNIKQLEKEKAERLKQQEEIMEAARCGKKPYIPNKTVMKRKKLVETYQTLKKSGKLEKYLERKRKKHFCKDKNRFYN